MPKLELIAWRSARAAVVAGATLVALALLLRRRRRCLGLLAVVLGLAACGGPTRTAPAPAPRFIESAPAPADPKDLEKLPPGTMLGSEIGDPADAPPPGGFLSKDQIRGVMRAHQREIRYCYERELVKNPSLAGTVVVKLVIGASGAVTSAVVASSTLGNPPVEGCIAQAVTQFTFPPPKGGGIVVVSYPYKLQTSDADGH
ncbi:MAG: AgmX/PglI C-terminal domain-containing protein [Deltaproteobacteria bacterium]|nr:AgmX/PglI C-terminal domain-containing protein [Deltaproteobacteria bacterium]